MKEPLLELTTPPYPSLAGMEACEVADLFGISEEVVSFLFAERRISSLYDWQSDCLRRISGLPEDENVLLCLPTSGGKTLIAEILSLANLLSKSQPGDVVLVLPFISLVQERIRELGSIADRFEFHLEEYAGMRGRIPPNIRRKRRSLFVCTIEKADLLCDHLIMINRMRSVGLVVVDEVHMLGEEKRGPTIERLLTKLRLVQSKLMNKTLQTMSMSATLDFDVCLGEFLGVRTRLKYDFRPVGLKEFVCLNRTEVHRVVGNSVEFSRSIGLNYDKKMVHNDPDRIMVLVLEVIPCAGCLVFCPTRTHCESLSKLIASLIPDTLKDYRRAERLQILSSMRLESDCQRVCPLLGYSIPLGVAYHHGGLTSEERRLIEDGFSSGILCVLVCTTTLSAGVNLPARRVIIRSPYSGLNRLSYSQYKQMAGRAGRAQMCCEGECYLYDDRNFLAEMFARDQPDEKCAIASQFSSGFEQFVLNLCILTLVSNENDIVEVAKSTLAGSQVSEKFRGAFLWLRQKRLIRVSDDAGGIEVTNLGRALFASGLDYEEAKAVYARLVHASDCLVLSSHLHLIFLVIPSGAVAGYESDIKFSWSNLQSIFASLSPANKRVCQLTANVTETNLARQIGCGLNNPHRSCSMSMNDVKRLYLALAVFEIFSGRSFWSITDRFHMSRGYVQTLVHSTQSTASAILRFCEHFQSELHWPYAYILPTFIQCLTHCSSPEIVALMDLPHVKKGRARQLYKAGFKSLMDLAKCTPEKLVDRIEHLTKRAASEIICAARNQLKDRAADLEVEIADIRGTLSQQKS